MIKRHRNRSEIKEREKRKTRNGGNRRKINEKVERVRLKRRMKREMINREKETGDYKGGIQEKGDKKHTNQITE